MRYDMNSLTFGEPRRRLQAAFWTQRARVASLQGLTVLAVRQRIRLQPPPFRFMERNRISPIRCAVSQQLTSCTRHANRRRCFASLGARLSTSSNQAVTSFRPSKLRAPCFSSRLCVRSLWLDCLMTSGVKSWLQSSFRRVNHHCRFAPSPTKRDE